MFRNILIISSNYTGNGHKSITEALVEQFGRYDDVKVHVLDGYSLSGSMGLRIGKMYGLITRTSKELYKLIWDVSSIKPKLLVELIESSITERLLKVLYTINPDAIIVTHPNYNGSVINVLQKNNISIPLFAMVADPVSITPLWADARADFTICPTLEAREKCLEFGVPDSRIRVFGFPIRQRFCQVAASSDIPAAYDTEKSLRCLIMSGGEGSGNMRRIAGILLKNFNCSIKIVCGRNKFLEKSLERGLGDKYSGRIEIIGFTDKIQELMLESDVLFTRASPNTMMEAVMCNLPLIITGALPGQEQGNPEFAWKYGLGVICMHTSELKRIVGSLLADKAALLNKIKRSQYEYRNPQSTANIVEFILNRD